MSASAFPKKRDVLPPAIYVPKNATSVYSALRVGGPLLIGLLLWFVWIVTARQVLFTVDGFSERVFTHRSTVDTLLPHNSLFVVHERSATSTLNECFTFSAAPPGNATGGAADENEALLCFKRAGPMRRVGFRWCVVSFFRTRALFFKRQLFNSCCQKS